MPLEVDKRLSFKIGAQMRSFSVCSLLIVAGIASAQEPNKLSESDKAIAEAKRVLENAKREAKSSDEKFRIDKAISALESTPKKVKHYDYKPGLFWDEGSIRYTVEKIELKPNSMLVDIHVTNISEKENLRRATWVLRTRSATFSDDTGRVYPPNGGGGITAGTASDPFVPAEKAHHEIGVQGRIGPKAKSFYIEFPETTDLPFIRIAVPAETIRDKK